MYLKFLSIADEILGRKNSDHCAYALDSESSFSDSRNRGGVLPQFRVYQTYGDRLTAHGPDWAIYPERLSDFLYSAVKDALAETNTGDEEPARYHAPWPDEAWRLFAQKVLYSGVSLEQIKFATTVKWKESDDQYDKRRFYSVKLQKIGGRSKENDKRFEEIRNWHDGTPKAIFRMVCPEYADPLERLILAEQIRDYLMANDGWMELPAVFLEWFDRDQHKARELHCAYQGARALALSYENRLSAENALSNYHPKPATEASETTAA